MNIKKVLGLFFACMFLISTVSVVAATDDGKIGTYMHINGPISVHQGETAKIKAELFGIESGYFGTDEWIHGEFIHVMVFGHGFKLYKSQTTDICGNAYFKVDTSNMEPGEYNIRAVFSSINKRYHDVEERTTLTVLPKE